MDLVETIWGIAIGSPASMGVRNRLRLKKWLFQFLIDFSDSDIHFAVRGGDIQELLLAGKEWSSRGSTPSPPQSRASGMG